ncbi:MAG TPA: PQQ-binding-like beta-propeller repeat protein, partial [Anaeromyxobacteraceae bacterium]
MRVGSGWKEDPGLRRSLLRGGDAAARALQAMAEPLAIEVEGVDLARGRAEGPLLAALTGLAEAAARLVAGRPRAAVSLADGAQELLLRRRGAAVLATLVSLERPSRLLAQDVEVELAALASAVGEAGDAFLADLAAVQPAAARSAPARELARALRRLAAARPAHPAPAAPAAARPPRLRRRPAALACAVEIHDEEGLVAAYRGPEPDLGSLLAPGRVALRAPQGAEVFAAEAPPFLVLRDLAALAERVAAAVRAGEPAAAATLALPRRRTLEVRVDLRRRTVAASGHRAVEAEPLAVAEALLEGALDFCGAAAARNPWQAENGYLAELRRRAAQSLAHVRELRAGDLSSAPRPGLRPPRLPRSHRRPLGPGRLRRLSWRRVREAEVGAPAGDGLFLAGGVLVAAGAAAVRGFDAASGAPRWRGPGTRWAGLAGRALLAAEASRLLRLDPASGRPLWERPPPGDGPPRAALWLRGALLVAAGGGLWALDPARGAARWRFEPPGASRLECASLGALALAASDAGFLYGVGADGGTAWRLLLPGPPAGPPVPAGRLCAIACAAPVGGALLAFDPATGRRLWEAPLDFLPSGPPVRCAGRLAVPGAVAGDAV